MFLLMIVFICDTIVILLMIYDFCFVKQKTADEWRISDWRSDLCSSDLQVEGLGQNMFVRHRHQRRNVELGQQLAQLFGIRAGRRAAEAVGLVAGIEDRKSVV